jgi:S1-C subfamily serine protease
MADVIAAVNRKQPGDELEVEVHRDGEERTIELELADRPNTRAD